MTHHPALTQALADARRAELTEAARATTRPDARPAAPFARWLRARRGAAAAIDAGACAEPARAGC